MASIHIQYRFRYQSAQVIPLILIRFKFLVWFIRIFIWEFHPWRIITYILTITQKIPRFNMLLYHFSTLRGWPEAHIFWLYVQIVAMHWLVALYNRSLNLRVWGVVWVHLSVPHRNLRVELNWHVFRESWGFYGEIHEVHFVLFRKSLGQR